MGSLDITSLFLYRWRYWIGYGLTAAALIGLLVFAGLYIPGGLSSSEIESVVRSDATNPFNFTSLAVTNLPYNLLQHASLSLFGVTVFSIKLPSLILGLFSAVGMILLLRRWFRPNVAVLASIITVTTGQFLFIAQNGTPGVLYLFWSVWLLLLASLVANRSRPRTLLKVAFFIVAALSLYTPLSIYALIALGSAIILHPHLRFLIRQLSRSKLLLGGLVAILLLVPLGYAIIKSPSLGLSLLGIPTQWPNLGANGMQLVHQYFGFGWQSDTSLMTPVFGLGSMLLLAIGAYRLFYTRERAQSYVIIIWSLCLLPFIFLNPTFTSVTFLPLVLLLATGLTALFSYWYRLFPRNPYARIAGLVPLIILVVALVLTGVDRYIYGYHYDPRTVANFSYDLKLLPKTTKHLVTSSGEIDFYKVVAKHNKSFDVSLSPSGDSFVATRAAHKPYPGYTIDRIVTAPNYIGGDRLYLYKKTAE